jgi:acyl-coenzyme A thioesterase PaaI-like protein
MSDDVSAPAPFDVPDGYQALDWTRGFGRQVGPVYARARDGRMAFRVEEHHTNGLGNAHGGMLMTFADVAWGHIVSVETSSYWVTIRLMCDFEAGAHVGDWVEGAGETLSCERGLYVVRGRIWVGDRTLVTGTGVYKTIARRDPRPGEQAFSATTQD